MAERSPQVTPIAARVVVVGLDMGDGELISRWARAGLLPNFQRLMARGAWFDLDSPAKILHTSTWPTFATGVLPGRHGVYYPFQPRPGHQTAQHVDRNEYGAESFWHLADKQGRRCIVYDVPETFPEEGFGGRAIFEWGTWAWYGERRSQPEGLADELKRRFGAYPLGIEALRLGLGKPSRTALEQRLPRSIAHKLESLRWLMSREPWDLVVVGFCETHPAGHYLWPLGGLVAEADGAAFAAIQRVYAALDRAVGALADQLPADATLLIVSGDGVRQNYAGWHLLPAVLERLGYTNAGPSSDPGSNQGSDPASDKSKSTPKPRSLLGRLKGMVPPRMRRVIADSLPAGLRTRLGAHLQTSQIDWAHTRAFTLPTDLEGYIRVNLQGREPFGTVQPGAEYARLCAELRRDLLALINPRTGRSAVSAVWLRDEVFAGDRREQLPDMVVSWNDEAPIDSLELPGGGLVSEPSPDPRTGTHSTTGFLLACGPSVAAGQRSSAHLTQVAPTVLQLLGLPKAFAFDGPPLPLHSAATVTQQQFNRAGG